jgi:single-stranded-DNA-specific exonuclease
MGKTEITADVRLDEGDDPHRVVTDLQSLEPCGEGNAAASIGIEGATVRSAKVVKGGHLKLELLVAGKTMSGFAAEMGDLATSIGGRVNVVGTLRRDSWRGGSAVEVKVTAIRGA